MVVIAVVVVIVVVVIVLLARLQAANSSKAVKRRLTILALASLSSLTFFEGRTGPFWRWSRTPLFCAAASRTAEAWAWPLAHVSLP